MNLAKVYLSYMYSQDDLGRRPEVIPCKRRAHSVVVTHLLAMQKTRVRFSLGALSTDFVIWIQVSGRQCACGLTSKS